jgi:peptide/nickel transport system ATP-binding protein
MTEALQVSDLRVELESGAPVVEEISFGVAAGEILGLVGESGCGKTTTALALLGYARPGVTIREGSVRVQGEELIGRSEGFLRHARGRLVSYVPQDAAVSLNPAMRVGSQVAGVFRARGGSGPFDDEVRGAFARVELPESDEFARRFPHQLSGGQQQRVALAIAFAAEPSVVVLDEPTTGLDVITQSRILDEIRRLRSVTRTAMVYVSHDLAVVSNLVDRVAVMYGGHIVELGETTRTLERPLHPYTAGLVASVPDKTPGRPLAGIGGVAVGAHERPRGCAFAPRCALATVRCTMEWPGESHPRPDAMVRCFEWQHTPSTYRGEDAIGVPNRGVSELVLSVEGLEAVYRTRLGSVTAAHDVSFEVRSGDVLAVVGESGSGKTTLARCIAGLHSPSGGRIRWRGVEVAAKARARPREVRRDIQIVFQNPYESLNPRWPIANQIARPARQLQGLDRAAAKREVAALLESVRLPVRTADRYPAELSGGERQRVAIARALAARPKLIICDEITSALDVSVQAAVLELLLDVRQAHGLSLLFISHDLGVVAAVADDALVLEAGRVKEHRRVIDLLERPQAEYTRELLAAAPALSRRAARPSAGTP